MVNIILSTIHDKIAEHKRYTTDDGLTASRAFDLIEGNGAIKRILMVLGHLRGYWI